MKINYALIYKTGILIWEKCFNDLCVVSMKGAEGGVFVSIRTGGVIIFIGLLDARGYL